MTTQSRSLRLADDLARWPWAWPGGYPRYGITHDGQPLCPSCCANERHLIGTTTGTDGWCLIATDINWEDPSLRCSHCAQSIDAAYVDS